MLHELQEVSSLQQEQNWSDARTQRHSMQYHRPRRPDCIVHECQYSAVCTLTSTYKRSMVIQIRWKDRKMFTAVGAALLARSTRSKSVDRQIKQRQDRTVAAVRLQQTLHSTTISVDWSIHPSMYLIAKCQHNANNNTIDNAKWSTEQKRETLC